MKRVRKPKDFTIKGQLGNKVELAWCYAEDGKRFWTTDYIMELDVHDAVRFARWIRSAILWLEKGQ